MTKPALDPKTCAELVASPRWKIEPAASGCFLAEIGSSNGSGYRQTKINGRRAYVHRIALVAALGRDIAAGHTVGHVCHDIAARAGDCDGGVACEHRRCVNPLHLCEQTQAENSLSSPHTVTARNADQTRRFLEALDASRKVDMT